MEDVRERVDLRVGEVHEPPVHPDFLDVLVRHGDLRLFASPVRDSTASIDPTRGGVNASRAPARGPTEPEQPGDRGGLGPKLSRCERGRDPAGRERRGVLGIAPSALGPDEQSRVPERKRRRKRLAARIEKKALDSFESRRAPRRTPRGPSIAGPARALGLLRGLFDHARGDAARARRRPRGLCVRSLTTRTSEAAPSSVAFSAIQASRSGRTAATQRWTAGSSSGGTCETRSIAIVTRSRATRGDAARGFGAAAVDEDDRVARGQSAGARVRGLLAPEDAGSSGGRQALDYEARARHRQTHSFSDRRPASFHRRPRSFPSTSVSRSRVTPERRMRPERPARARIRVASGRISSASMFASDEVETAPRGRERSRVEPRPSRRRDGAAGSRAPRRSLPRRCRGRPRRRAPSAAAASARTPDPVPTSSTERPSSASSSRASRARRVDACSPVPNAREAGSRSAMRPFGGSASLGSPGSIQSLRPTGNAREAARKASSGSPSAMSVVRACLMPRERRSSAAARAVAAARKNATRSLPSLSNPRGAWSARRPEHGVVAGFLRHEQAAEARAGQAGRLSGENLLGFPLKKTPLSADRRADELRVPPEELLLLLRRLLGHAHADLQDEIAFAAAAEPAEAPPAEADLGARGRARRRSTRSPGPRASGPRPRRPARAWEREGRAAG